MESNRKVCIRPIANGYMVEVSWTNAQDTYFDEERYAKTLPKALKMIKTFFTVEDVNVLPF